MKPTIRGLQVLTIGFFAMLTALVIGKVEVGLLFGSVLIGGLTAYVCYYPIFCLVSIPALAPILLPFIVFIASAEYIAENKWTLPVVIILVIPYYLFVATPLSDKVYKKFEEYIEEERAKRPTFME